jgi:hypothetical protein
MRRALIIAAWIAGTTVPLLAGTVFYFGCCVLPFHRVMHKLAAPLCHIATHAAPGDDHDTVPPPKPAKRISGIAAHTIRIASIAATSFAPITRPASYRDFLAHGAVRCDRDVGLHLLVETFRI